MARRMPEDVLGKTNWRQGNLQTYVVLFGEWLCTAPDIAWIILSQSWLPTKAEKWTRQLDFILNNANVKRHIWFTLIWITTNGFT